jgi:RNA polymerase sigma-70 factor (ECF subfamily)
VAISESSARSYALRDPDVRLMLDVRDDNGAAFDELVVRYQSRLVTVLEHLVGRKGDAEALAQDVFLRVYRSRKTYVPGSKFSTWLFTIANNVASNYRRSISRRREVNLDSQDSGNQGGNPLDTLAKARSGEMPTRQLDKLEMQDVVRTAVEQLPERQRMATVLRQFENMSYAEIAECMEMSTQAVKSLLSRARENLCAILQPYIERGESPETMQ